MTVSIKDKDYVRIWKDIVSSGYEPQDMGRTTRIPKEPKFIEKDKWALQGRKNRRLSWLECAAIQGLPPRIAPSGTLMDKYRVVGNAVPPALGKALLAPIVQFEVQNGR